MSSQGVPQPLSLVIDGLTWRLYEIEYKTPDGTFATHIYAISFEHAQLMLDDLKATGRVRDCVRGVSADE